VCGKDSSTPDVGYLFRRAIFHIVMLLRHFLSFILRSKTHHSCLVLSLSLSLGFKRYIDEEMSAGTAAWRAGGRSKKHNDLVRKTGEGRIVESRETDLDEAAAGER
jgi:hypothetical protein